MRLLRLADVGSTPSDRVFFYSRIRALLFGFTVLGAAGWILFYSTSRAWKPGYYIAAAVLLFLELIRRFVTARFRPSNWLVRMNDLGLFIQFRSYLNYQRPDCHSHVHRPQVVWMRTGGSEADGKRHRGH